MQRSNLQRNNVLVLTYSNLRRFVSPNRIISRKFASMFENCVCVMFIFPVGGYDDPNDEEFYFTNLKLLRNLKSYFQETSISILFVRRDILEWKKKMGIPFTKCFPKVDGASIE